MDTKPLIAGLVILLALVGTTYYITNLEQTYFCEDKNVVSMCFKLSNPTNGISSRCYYNETAPTKYYACNSGWKSIKNFPNIMNNLTIAGNEIIEMSYDTALTTDMSAFIKTDFNSKYGIVTLTGPTGKEAEYSLTDNTEFCIVHCEAEGKVTLYSDRVLFDNAKFKTLMGQDTNIKSYEYLIFNGYQDNYVDVPDTYKKVCISDDEINNTEGICTQEVLTYKKINQPIEIWDKYTGATLKAGDYRWKIKGVKEGSQSVDFIPIIGDKQITQWAVWTDGLSAGLRAYYDFNNTLSKVNPTRNNFTIAQGAPTLNLTNGKIGYGVFFDGNDCYTPFSNGGDNVFNFTAGLNATMNFWFKKDAVALVYVMGKGTINPGWDIVWGNGGVDWQYRYPTAGFIMTAADPTANKWAMMTLTINSTDACWYMNGTLSNCKGSAIPASATNTAYYFGCVNDGSWNYGTYYADEMGWWNRSLTATEISDLYNNGDGLTYGAEGLSIAGKVLDNNNNNIANAVVIILNGTGGYVGQTISNASGSWDYTSSEYSIINYTVMGYNPNNVSQGGNAYPFISG